MSDAGNSSGARDLKRGKVELQLGKPLRFIEDAESAAHSGAVGAGEQQANALQVATAIKAYRNSAKALLSEKYADLRDYAPSHLREPCAVTVLCCADGMIVRYDRAEVDQPKIRSGAVSGSLAEMAPLFSDSFIHFPTDPKSYDPGEGLQLELTKFDATGAQTPISKVRPVIYASATLPPTIVPPPHRPPCLVSITSELEIIFQGVVEPVEASPTPQFVAKSQEFLAHGKLPLDVGWRAIEVYPSFDASYWKAEYAPLWAETDLLAAVAQRQFRDAQFSAFDPNVAARKAFNARIVELESLLEGPEESAHQFLKEHPELLSPTHTAYWSKLPFGDRVSDFVFREPGVDYLLVEIESPLRELFRKDGQQRQELTHAFNQILDWRVHLEDNLEAVRENLGLAAISTNPRSLIVIGRDSELSAGNRRKLTTLQNQVPNLRILTYDDLIRSAKAVAENLFGPLGMIGSNVEIYYAPAKATGG